MREIADKLKMGKTVVGEVVQQMRQRMESDGQPTEGEETDE